jgi:Stigma-specific protein, Stig1
MPLLPPAAVPRGSGAGGLRGTGGVGGSGAGGLRGTGGVIAGVGGSGAGGLRGTGGVVAVGVGGSGAGGLRGMGGMTAAGVGGSGAGGSPCAGRTMCGSACTDIASDLHNCGACGHDCRFGTCAQSQCVPALLATATNLVELASDGSSVYGLDSFGGIAYGCTLAQCGGGGMMAPIRTGLASPVQVLPVPSVGSVFISQFASGVVFNLSPTGAVKSMITIPSATLTIGLTTDGANLYVGTASSLGVQKTPLTANTPTMAFPAAGREVLYDPTSDAVFAVLIDRVMKCPAGGTSCTTFYPPTPFQMNGVAIAGGRLFFTLIGDPQTAASSGLYMCPTQAITCNVTPLLTPRL